MKSIVVFGMIGLGVLLLLLSGVWSSMQVGTSAWTNEKDRRLSEASDKMHLLTAKIASAESHPSMHGGPDLPKAKAELAAWKWKRSWPPPPTLGRGWKPWAQTRQQPAAWRQE